MQAWPTLRPISMSSRPFAAMAEELPVLEMSSDRRLPESCGSTASFLRLCSPGQRQSVTITQPLLPQPQSEAGCKHAGGSRWDSPLATDGQPCD